MDRFAKLLNKITDNTVRPGDETAMANNPRNALADAVNPLLDNSINQILPESFQLGIPKMTVAEDKQFFQNLPEQMGSGAMGRVGAIEQGAGRFGKILQMGNQAEQNLGKVITKPTMADLVDDASKIGGKKTLDAAGIKSKFDELYGAEAAARKADVKKGLKTPEAYDSWKQEMMNKIRGQ